MLNSDVRVKSSPIIPIDCGKITIGHGGMITLDIAGFIDGEEIFSRESHSYLTPFAFLLFHQMKQSRQGIYDGVTQGSPVRLSGHWQQKVAAATREPTCRISLDPSSSINTSTWIQIRGATGMPELNMREVWAKNVGTDIFDLYTDDTETTPIDSSAWGVYDGNSARAYPISQDVVVYSQSGNFNSPFIWCGLGTAAVAIEDQSLDNFYTKLDEQAVNVPDVPQVLSAESYIQVTRDFQNNTGSTVAVEEIGSFVKAAGSTIEPMISRDLQTISILNTKVLTLRLRYKTTIDLSAGGILQQFNDLMYRQMRATSFSSTDINGAGKSNGAHGGQFACSGVGGGHIYASNSNDRGPGTSYLQGPLLGTDPASSLAVGISNSDLGTRIVHGRSSNQLVHHGSIVHDFVEDTGASDKASFKVTRIFKNESGGPITVQEVGLAVSGDPTMDDTHLIVRKIHDGAGGRPASTVIADGDVCEAVWTVEVAV